MNSFDFRERVMKDIRAFEKWAYTDATENPDEWDLDSMEFTEWMDMFLEYLTTR